MSGEEELRNIDRVVIGESSVDAVDGAADNTTDQLPAGEITNNSDQMEDEAMEGTAVDPECGDEDIVEAVRSEDQVPGSTQAGESQHGGGDASQMGSEGRMEDSQSMTNDGRKEEEKTGEGVKEESNNGEAREDAESDPNQPEKSNEPAEPRAGEDSTRKKTDDSDEEVDVGDLSQLTEDGRNMLFGRGLVYERAGKKSCALKCYLACLSHLTPQSNFVLLPQCLRNIADLYYRKEQYEKAILFIQAEKLFYENALIDTSEVQQKIESLQEGLENPEVTRSSEDAKIAADSLRADEYEHLAKLCVDKKQPQLALEYAGKATKIRQKIYGNDNPITKESLDFFATLYAEVGKQQYSDSMSQLTEPVEEDGESVSPPVTPSMERSPSSILRQRKTGESESERKKQVRFQEPEGSTTSTGTDSRRENEEFISHTLLWVLFFICLVLLCILGLWLYCTLTDSLACRMMSAELQYFYMKIKYYYYQYASTKKIKYT